jgi:mannose-1-phosphate guanylyltransferase
MESKSAVNAETFAIIMAGGVGTRLWPLSRKNRPKQFLDFFGDGTMIEKSVERLKGLVPTENILIVTNKQGKELALAHVPEIPAENIIVEPVGRNTAPCIALATAYIRKLNPNATAIVLPADHLIPDTARFQQTLSAAIEIANRASALVTLGIKPTRPETGYGYIQNTGGDHDLVKSVHEHYDVRAYRVKTFAEKPDHETAKKFLESGDFLWNSGVFIWQINDIIREFERSMPELYKDMLTIYECIGMPEEHETIDRIYSWTHAISIDYGIMEKADLVYVIEGTFEWSDLGSWDEVMKYRLKNGEDDPQNMENVFLHDAENTVVFKPKGKVVAVIGLEDIIVVDTEDALLICKRNMSQEVKTVVDALKRKQLEVYM